MNINCTKIILEYLSSAITADVSENEAYKQWNDDTISAYLDDEEDDSLDSEFLNGNYYLVNIVGCWKYTYPEDIVTI